MNQVEVKSNGMTASYNTTYLQNPQALRQIADELEQFYKLFFRNTEAGVDWRDCMSNEDVFDVMTSFEFLENDFIIKVDNELGKANLLQESMTIDEAFELVKKDIAKRGDQE